MKIKAIILIILVFGSGCGQEFNTYMQEQSGQQAEESEIIPKENRKYLSLYRNPNFRGSIERSYFEAIDEINRSQGEEAVLTKQDDKALRVEVSYVDFNEPGVVGLWSCNSNMKNCKIQIANKINPDQFSDEKLYQTHMTYTKIVILHEIGHAFGLHHIDDNTNIMFWQVVWPALEPLNLTKFFQNVSMERNDGKIVANSTLANNEYPSNKFRSKNSHVFCGTQ